jgi:uncharacterized membrane protein YuzA (DUF378 family)
MNWDALYVLIGFAGGCILVELKNLMNKKYRSKQRRKTNA